MSGDLHNIQVMLSQIPRVQKLSEHQDHLIPNGNQIINLELEEERTRNVKKVREFEEVYHSKAEDSEQSHLRNREKRQRKREHKKKGDKETLLDIYG